MSALRSELENELVEVELRRTDWRPNEAADRAFVWVRRVMEMCSIDRSKPEYRVAAGPHRHEAYVFVVR